MMVCSIPFHIALHLRITSGPQSFPPPQAAMPDGVLELFPSSIWPAENLAALISGKYSRNHLQNS